MRTDSTVDEENKTTIGAEQEAVMPFWDAPLGCRFRYESSNPETAKTWIKLSDDHCGLIAEYHPKHIMGRWAGQQVCSFADSPEELGSINVIVVG